MVKNLPSSVGDEGLVSDQETEIPHVVGATKSPHLECTVVFLLLRVEYFCNPSTWEIRLFFAVYLLSHLYYYKCIGICVYTLGCEPTLTT